MDGIESLSENARSACKSLIEYFGGIEDYLEIIVIKLRQGEFQKASEDLIDFADHMNLAVSGVDEVMASIPLGDRSLTGEQFQEGVNYLITSMKDFVEKQSKKNIPEMVNCIEEDLIPCLKTWRTFYIPSMEQSLI